jgi:cellobiose-specific phosphotransferase system component IIB
MGKIAVEQLKIETWANPQIKNQKKSHAVKLIKPQIRHKSPEHMYLNS